MVSARANVPEHGILTDTPGRHKSEIPASETSTGESASVRMLFAATGIGIDVAK
jgi:hypothetical protein